MKVTITFTIPSDISHPNGTLQILWETISNILALAGIGDYEMKRDEVPY